MSRAKAWGKVSGASDPIQVPSFGPRPVWFRPEGGHEAQGGAGRREHPALCLASLAPTQIVPKLADEGKYPTSESTVCRTLREAGELAAPGTLESPFDPPNPAPRREGPECTGVLRHLIPAGTLPGHVLFSVSRARCLFPQDRRPRGATYCLIKYRQT